MKTQFAILIILIIIMILIYNFGNYFYDLVDPEFIVDDQEDNIITDFKPIPVIKTQRSMDHKWLYDATFQELNLEEHPIWNQKISDAVISQSSALAPIYNMANHPALVNFIYQAPINYTLKQFIGDVNVGASSKPTKNNAQESDKGVQAVPNPNLTTTLTTMSSRGTTNPNTTTTTTSANDSYSTTLTLTTLFSTTPYSTTPYSTTPTATPTFTTTLPNYKYLGQIYLINNINSGDNVITVDGSTIFNEAGTTPSINTSPGATTTNEPVTTASPSGSSFIILPGMTVLINGNYYTITGVDMETTNSSTTTTNINAFTLKEAFSNNTINLDGEVIGSVSQGTYLNIYLSNNHSTSAAPSTTPYLSSTTPYSTSTTPYLSSTTPYLTSTTPYLTSTTPYLTSTPMPNSTPESNSNSINTTTTSINTTTTSSSLNVVLIKNTDFGFIEKSPNSFIISIVLGPSGCNKLKLSNLIANGSNKFCFIFNNISVGMKVSYTAKNKTCYLTMPSSGLMLKTVQPSEWSVYNNTNTIDVNNVNTIDVNVSGAIQESIDKEPSFTDSEWDLNYPPKTQIFYRSYMRFDLITVIPENLYTIAAPDAYLILDTDYTCSISTTPNVKNDNATTNYYNLNFHFTPAGMKKINYYFTSGINDFYFYYAASTSNDAVWGSSVTSPGNTIDKKDFNIGIHISSNDKSITKISGESFDAYVELLSFSYKNDFQSYSYINKFNYNKPNNCVYDHSNPNWFVPQTNLYFFNGNNNPTTPPTLIYNSDSSSDASRWK